MAAQRAAASLHSITSTLRGSRDPLMQCLAPVLSRSMATEANLPSQPDIDLDIDPLSSLSKPGLTRRAPPEVAKVLTTIYSFPHMEPTRFAHYSAEKLNLPLRRDILHRAVIFEADAARQGTASTKNRWEVRGSTRKIRPQKGTGRARLGDKKSPMLKGGGVAHGPRPRDFSTDLPKKIYDLAWRTALSYRYRRGELLVIEDKAELEMPEPRWLQQIMKRNHWGKENGKSTVITEDFRENLFTAFAGIPEHGKIREKSDVDVKNLLESGRIIIEKSILDQILRFGSDFKRLEFE